VVQWSSYARTVDYLGGLIFPLDINIAGRKDGDGDVTGNIIYLMIEKEWLEGNINIAVASA